MPRQAILVCLALAALIATGCAPALVAAPRLIAAWPAAGATLPVDSHTLDLTFNRPLNAASTSAVVSSQRNGAPMATQVEIDSAHPRHMKVRLLEPAAGDYRLHWHAVAAQTGEGADGDHPFTLQSESLEPARLDIAESSADKGDRLNVVGRGFARQSVVQLTMGDDDQPLATVQTDTSGSLKSEVEVPASVPYGAQPVSAIDARGGGARTSVLVRWGGWPPVVSTDIGQPGPDVGQVTFSVVVRNRSDYVVEHVRVVLMDPDGAVLVSADPSPQRQAGLLEWEIPVMDRGTIGPFRATYRTNTAVASHAWLEFRHRRPRGCTWEGCPPAFISESTSESALVGPAE